MERVSFCGTSRENVRGWKAFRERKRENRSGAASPKAEMHSKRRRVACVKSSKGKRTAL